MSELPVAMADSVASAAPAEQPIDLAHLFRMTLGDKCLEREVLQLFERQVEIVLARIRQAEQLGVASLAHTLKGSARGIGAWQVAQAAEAVELAAANSAPTEDAIGALCLAAAQARAAIAKLLQAP